MATINHPSAKKSKSLSRKIKTKEGLGPGDKSDNQDVSVNNQLQKLENLKGLSIMRSGNESKTPQLAKASKSALGDISTQLDMRKSKGAMIADLKAAKTLKSVKSSNPNLKQIKPTSSANPPLSTKNKCDDEAMKALLKSSLPKNIPKPALDMSSPAMSSVLRNIPKPALDMNSPAMQRKLLFEKLAAEKADEKLKESRKLRNQIKKNYTETSDDSQNGALTPNNVQPSTSSNTKKLVKDSIALLSRPIVKKEPELHNDSKVKDTSVFQNEILKAVSRKNRNTNHRAPLIMNFKKESIEITDEENVENQEPVPIQSLPVAAQPPPPIKASLTTEQAKILTKQFEIKDYLSRKEMRSIAKQSGLTDAQVRDWFKERRIQEDTPMIVDEKQSDVQLSNMPVNIKQEPIDVEVPNDVHQEASVIAKMTVKQEPEDDENEPDSAVLDPLTGNLLKKSKVDQKIEEILAKAPLLDSLTKKIEMVNNPKNDGKEKFKDKINGILDILDDEIEITKENIVNPGPKEKPLAKVLNKFLTQVEQLEKSINVNECSKNVGIEAIMKEANRKDESINDLTTEVKEKKTEVKYLEKELQDKNDELESILLNSVSKETFIRTQFQGLTSEVRKLKQERSDEQALHEKIRQLEKNLRKKGYEAVDWKEKYESSQTMLTKKDQELGQLEEMSTKMVGDITKGIGEKLAAAKARELEFKARELEFKTTLEKNESLEFDLQELGKTFKQQNEDLVRIKEEEKILNEQLSVKNGDLTENVKERDEEIAKLKGQVNNLTKRFREKVKEIQETLSKYNITLQSKNNELADKGQEISEMKEHKATQGHLIEKLKDSIGKQLQDIIQLKNTEETLRTDISGQKAMFEEYKINHKIEVERQSNERIFFTDKNVIDLSTKRGKPEEQKALENFSHEPQLLFALNILPSFESPFSMQFPVQVPSPLLRLGYNWPLVSYQPNNLLLNLQFLVKNSSSNLLFRTYEDPNEENSLEDLENVSSKRKNIEDPSAEELKNVSSKKKNIEDPSAEELKNVSSKRKNIEVISSSKRFRVSPANRPVSCLKNYS
eukprot:GFUD01001216.1.p1 GENE.GFUD01001216.1~~GFUD01001216.1.p1  ORF type:complete len:1061 (+),score=343.61 GFUD01001216.1:137-3319(+)